MPDKLDLWDKLPKPSFDKKKLTRRMRKAEGATIKHANRFVFKRWENIHEVQRHVIIWVLAMGVLIAATGLQLMWNQQSYQTKTSAENGIYAEAALGPVETLNPLFANSSAEKSASDLMFSRLLNYDRTGHLNYDLATNVRINNTNTVYTINIRPDVKWHDGVKLTAKDVAFTVGLMKDPNTRTVFSGWSDIGVKAIDNTTIEFTLKSAFAPFLHALVFPIIPEHALKGVTPLNLRENSFSQNPIGSGPFKFNLIQSTDATSGRKVIYLTRNDNYYGGTAKLSRFQLHTYNTDSEILSALSKNEVNAATDLSSTDIGSINKSHYDILTKPIQNGVYALLNTRSALLKDAPIRRALQMATDAAAIRKKLPTAIPALWLPFTNGQLTGNIPGAPVFDLASAKKLLDDNGWKLNKDNIREKAGTKLKLSVVTTKDNELESVLQTLTDQWKELGVTTETKIINLNNATQSDAQNILQPRNFDVLLYQLDIGADPDEYAYWHSSQASTTGLNYSNYSNQISDDALISGRARIEPALRNAKYITFANQWLSDVPAIGLYQPTTEYAVSKGAQTFDSSNKLVSSVDRYGDILNWAVGSRTVYKTP
ncbi:MAG: peptide ABC transporter substrate-binding protein [Candidatus Saccharibacteria bacterium]|nr:peptide ABC transporter substrate-binding protein [Candidatus Saccharibacteria bacterium]